jgi:histidinol phosphatase-like enzyme (inositol monophosphatase family)
VRERGGRGTSESLQTLLDAAGALARVMGDVAMRHYKSNISVEFKRDGSPVTAADREAERRAREWVEARFPEDGVLGEEFGESRPGARRRWIIDPIDGTKSFVRGVPLWGSLVAIAEGEQVLAGAMYCPPVGESVAAATGLGCWWNGSRCRVSTVSDLSHATLLTTDDRFPTNTGRRARFDALAQRVAVSRSWGDCYGYLLVATGRAEIMVDDIVSAWDAAALLPIVTESGGVFTDWRGRPTAFGGSAIATNGVLAGPVRELLSPALAMPVAADDAAALGDAGA